MNDEEAGKHGKDASDKPEGGSKQADDPEHGSGTGEGEGGLGTQTGGAGGEAPLEPGDERKREQLKE